MAFNITINTAEVYRKITTAALKNNEAGTFKTRDFFMLLYKVIKQTYNLRVQHRKSIMYIIE